MMKILVAFVVAVVLATVCIGPIAGCHSSSSAESEINNSTSDNSFQTRTKGSEKPGVGMAAVQEAADAKKYLFALFHKANDSQTNAMRSVLEDVIKEVADRASLVEVDITASSEKAIVDKYGLDRAPMPLILAIAPNGAVTGGFPTEVDKQKLLDAFASPTTEKCMKQLQNNRLVLLCVQNGDTKLNDEALQGVRDLKDDTRFAHATEIVMLDPTDTAEVDFLKDLQIDPKTEKAVTVFLAPPGVPVGKYEGATSKDELVASLQKASSACGPGGCGPGGCGPQK